MPNVASKTRWPWHLRWAIPALLGLAFILFSVGVLAEMKSLEHRRWLEADKTKPGDQRPLPPEKTSHDEFIQSWLAERHAVRLRRWEKLERSGMSFSRMSPETFARLNARARWWQAEGLVMAQSLVALAIIVAAITVPMVCLAGYRQIRPTLVGGIRFWWGARKRSANYLRGLVEEAKDNSEKEL